MARHIDGLCRRQLTATPIQADVALFRESTEVRTTVLDREAGRHLGARRAERLVDGFQHAAGDPYIDDRTEAREHENDDERRPESDPRAKRAGAPLMGSRRAGSRLREPCG